MKKILAAFLRRGVGNESLRDVGVIKARCPLLDHEIIPPSDRSGSGQIRSGALALPERCAAQSIIDGLQSDFLCRPEACATSRKRPLKCGAEYASDPQGRAVQSRLKAPADGVPLKFRTRPLRDAHRQTAAGSAQVCEDAAEEFPSCSSH